MTPPELDGRLLRLKAELDDHARIARHLGLDFERPVQSLGDGYPENAVALVGKITERLLKQLWRHHDVPGTPAGKTLKDLISGCRPYIRSPRVLDALHDIQRMRNRSAHDGYLIADEDGLAALRRLLDVLAWYTSTGSGALGTHAPRLSAAVAAKAEFLAGLYVTLDYKPAKRFELSRHTVYQLFVRERGLRSEYVELLLSRDTGDVAKVLHVTGGKLLQTGLPKLTRFLVLDDHPGGSLPAPLRDDCRVLTYDRFMDAFVDLDRHLASVTGSYPRLEPGLDPAPGELLTTSERTAEMSISSSGDALAILRQVAAEGGNLLVIGRPGSGKTTLLKHLVSAAGTPGTRRYRFFFDLSLKGKDEPFPVFVTRTLAPYMPIEAAYVYPVLCYFARTGSLMCALDGLDEAVPAMTQAGFLTLFTQIAELLSAESATIMTSRVSFLEDSPHVRRLLDGTALMAEKLIQQLHAHGVDPLHVPRFSVLRLHDTPDGGPLRRQLARQAAASPAGPTPPAGTPGRGTSLDTLLQEQITRLAPPQLLPQLVTFFGSAFLRGTTIFPLVDIVNELGIGIFDSGQVTLSRFRLRELFRSARSDGTAVAFRHAVLQELLTAEFLRTPAGREAALAAAAQPRLTEQVREFLHRRSHPAGAPDTGTGTCLVPAGVYLVGPGHHLMLRQIRAPYRLDQFPVTVHRYKQFLEAITQHGPTPWDHPDQPAGHTHQPWRERLRVPDYYDNPAYASHPAIGINWWSAYAFARYEGKRLPTSLEWEVAARGTDGRLFPWGDEPDLASVNCADSWSDHPLITYEAWRDALGHGQLADALPQPVDAHPGNVSPFGIREMAGNTWEWTATTLKNLNEAVICGGSFDNPYRAIQASTKGTYRRRGASNAVGFRCAQDIEP